MKKIIFIKVFVILFFQSSLLAQEDPIVGTWNFIMQTPQGEQAGQFLFKNEGAYYTGLIRGEDGSSEEKLKNITLTNNKLVFEYSINAGGQSIVITVDGIIKEDRYVGTWKVQGYEGIVVAERIEKPQSMHDANVEVNATPPKSDKIETTDASSSDLNRQDEGILAAEKAVAQSSGTENIQKTSANVSSNSVSIVASGTGATKEEAELTALRSAISQAFGTFVSSKTEVLNDSLVADEIVMISSGNIEAYDILNEAQAPSGIWGVTLKAHLSVDKLIGFAESKGIEVEFKGGLFAAKIKMQKLNEDAEVKIIMDLLEFLHELMQDAFDYTLEVKDPESLDEQTDLWAIPITVQARTNDTYIFCMNYFQKTLRSISLSQEEVRGYRQMKKEVYPIKYTLFEYNIVIPDKRRYDEPIYLRKKESFKLLHALTHFWESYIKSFIIINEVDSLDYTDILSLYTKAEPKYAYVYYEALKNNHISKFYMFGSQHVLRNYSTFEDPGPSDRLAFYYQRTKFDIFPHRPYFYREDKFSLGWISSSNRNDYVSPRWDESKPLLFNFLFKGEIAGEIRFRDVKTLTELEQISKYSVESIKLPVKIKHGGLVISETAGHGTVLYPVPVTAGKTYDESNQIVENLDLLGFNDWRFLDRNKDDVLFAIKSLLHMNVNPSIDGDSFWGIWELSSRSRKVRNRYMSLFSDRVSYDSFNWSKSDDRAWGYVVREF